MLTYYKQTKAETTSTNLTWLYFNLHILIRIFCTLFICFMVDDLLQFYCGDIFYVKFRFCETFKAISSVTRNSLIEYFMYLELLSVELPYTYTCMLNVSINPNILHIPPSFLLFKFH